ncbi:MAG: CPBP family intramembrane metalloprotease [Chloroflexi bacterium]|nr:CPBP family intramembrane metalloprotease [Chloroflexota bacterium]
MKDMVMATALVAVVSILGVIIASAILFFMGYQGDEIEEPLILGGTMMTEVAMIGAAAWFCLAKYHRPWRALGLRSFRAHGSWIWVWVVLGAGFASNAIYGVIVTQLGWKFLEPSPVPPFFREDGSLMAGSAFLAIVAAPLAEEIFFRGFIFAGISSRYGFWWGASLSALLFALGHFEIAVLIPVFVFGVLLAWLYARTRSIWPTIITHGIYNSIVLLLII